MQTPAPPAPMVMVIDDHADSREILTDLLWAWGYRSIACGKPWEALPIAAAEQPMAFIIDIGLPEIDGYSLAWMLKKEHPNAVFLANSGWPRRLDREAELGFEFDLYLLKPDGLAEMKNFLKTAMAGL